MTMTTPQPSKLEIATNAIETVVKECSVVALRDAPALMQAVQLARGIKKLKEILPKEVVEGDFMPLQNTSLGFLTDKPEGYGWEVVRDCIVEGLLRGFRPINNELNIISSKFYGAKNGFERNVREYPALRDLQYDLAVPVLTPQGALVGYRARWLLAGEPMEMIGSEPANGQLMDTRIPVKVNSGMGPDAILGKATRKMFARIYNRIMGVTLVDADGEEMPPKELPAVADPTKDGQRMSLGGKPKNGTAAPATTEAPEPGSNG